MRSVAFLASGILVIFFLLNIIGCSPLEVTTLEQTQTTVPNINIMTINVTAVDCYYSCSCDIEEYDSSTSDVPNILEFYKALEKIPVSLQQVMNGKTFYLSDKCGRGYAVLGSWPECNILSYLGKGCILEQPITEDSVLHEFAHILDYHGIRGIYNDPQAHWTHLETARRMIFSVNINPLAYNPNLQEPGPGFISIYAMANDAENFAEHFVAYILDGERFCELAASDPVLESKYVFFKNSLFDGYDYSLANSSNTYLLKHIDN